MLVSIYFHIHINIKINCGDEQTLQQTYFRITWSASCVQNFDDSLRYAIRITYRISLRSSSLWEPRHSLLKVIGWHYVLIRGLSPLITFYIHFCSWHVTRRRIYMAQPQVDKQTEHPKILTTFGSLTGSRYTRSFPRSLWQPQVLLSC